MLSLVPLLVPEHELRGAIALNAATYNLARAIGPVLGAVISTGSAPPPPSALNAFSYLALIAWLLAVHPRAQPARPPERPKLRESIQIVRGDAYLVLLLVAVMVVAVVTDPVTTLTPGFVKDIFDQPKARGSVPSSAPTAPAPCSPPCGPAGCATRERTLAMGLTIMGVGTLLFALAPNVERGCHRHARSPATAT